MERTPFYGTKISPNLKALVHLCSKKKQVLGLSTQQQLIRLASSTMEGKPVTAEMLANVAKTSSSACSDVHIAFAGLLRVLQYAMRRSQTSLSPSDFLNDVMSLDLDEVLCQELSSAVFGPRRQVIDKTMITSKPGFNRLANCSWKVDVIISSNAVQKHLEPKIAMRLFIGESTLHFDMSVEVFQRLRYNVAKSLGDIEDLENRNILKIQD